VPLCWKRKKHTLLYAPNAPIVISTLELLPGATSQYTALARFDRNLSVWEQRNTDGVYPISRSRLESNLPTSRLLGEFVSRKSLIVSPPIEKNGTTQPHLTFGAVQITARLCLLIDFGKPAPGECLAADAIFRISLPAQSLARAPSPEES
jgi:hypothetical protein